MTRILQLAVALSLAGCGLDAKDVGDSEREPARDAGGQRDAGKPECREPGAGTDPDRNAVAPGELCARLAAIQCAAECACCDHPGRDFDRCMDALTGTCASDLMFDRIAMQPRSGFDAAQARVVLDEFERRAAECDPHTAEFGESQEGLRSMFRGTIAPGGNCRPSNILDAAMAGAALSSCTMGEAYACLPSPSSWTCNERSGEGGACFTDINCLPGHYCPNPELDLSGATCTKRKDDGDACSGHNECRSLHCVGGTCVAADRQVAWCPE